METQPLFLPGMHLASGDVHLLFRMCLESAPHPLPPPRTTLSSQDNGTDYPPDSELPLLHPEGVLSTQQPGQSFYKLQTGQCHGRPKAPHRFLIAENKIPTLRGQTLPSHSRFVGATVLGPSHTSPPHTPAFGAQRMAAAFPASKHLLCPSLFTGPAPAQPLKLSLSNILPTFLCPHTSNTSLHR